MASIIVSATGTLPQERLAARVPAPARRGVRCTVGRQRGAVVALVSHGLLPSMKKARAGHARRHRKPWCPSPCCKNNDLRRAVHVPCRL